MNKKIIISLSVFVLVVLAFSIITFLPKPIKKLDCSQAPDVYYLKPNENGSIKSILHSNENALIIIPKKQEIRGNSALFNCSNLDLNLYLHNIGYK